MAAIIALTCSAYPTRPITPATPAALVEPSAPDSPGRKIQFQLKLSGLELAADRLV